MFLFSCSVSKRVMLLNISLEGTLVMSPFLTLITVVGGCFKRYTERDYFLCKEEGLRPE